MSADFQYRITPFGEFGWIVQLEGANDPVAAALYVNAVADALRSREGVADCVAGVDSLVLRTASAVVTIDEALAMLEDGLGSTPKKPRKPNKRIDIPVCYGGEFGPDFESLKIQTGLSERQIIDAHSNVAYRVLVVGFAPGFAYLGPLDASLAAPRLATPRSRVPAGSVGVAGAMTGVYPLASPGGWRIIGRTPEILFNHNTDNPFRFASGDEVRFTPIDANAFWAAESKNP